MCIVSTRLTINKAGAVQTNKENRTEWETTFNGTQRTQEGRKEDHRKDK